MHSNGVTYAVASPGTEFNVRFKVQPYAVPMVGGMARQVRLRGPAPALCLAPARSLSLLGARRCTAAAPRSVPCSAAPPVAPCRLTGTLL